MNKKGFMIVETLVASTIILGALIYLFIQFSSIKRSYDTNFKYDTIPSLYKTREVANFINKNNVYLLETKLNNNISYGYITYMIKNCEGYYESNTTTKLCEELIKKIDAKYVIYTEKKIEKLQKDIYDEGFGSQNFDEEFKKYILNLDTDIVNGNRRLIIEYNDGTFASVNLNLGG